MCKLYSSTRVIAIYWCNEPDTGVELLDEAIRLALELGMNRRDFAQENSQNDPILAESWRRTWWQIYITDAHIAGSTHKYPFRCSHIEMTVDLPCEEVHYASGVSERPYLRGRVKATDYEFIEPSLA